MSKLLPHPQRVATDSQPASPGAVHVATLVEVEPSGRVVAATVIDRPQSARKSIPQYCGSLQVGGGGTVGGPATAAAHLSPQHTAIHGDIQQHTAAHGSTRQHTVVFNRCVGIVV